MFRSVLVSIFKRFGINGTYEACEPKPMEPKIAIGLIKEQVMPWLRRAKQCIKTTSPDWEGFQIMHNFFELWFGKDVQPETRE
jgi:hypothetical protein